MSYGVVTGQVTLVVRCLVDGGWVFCLGYDLVVLVVRGGDESLGGTLTKSVT